jgi:hypothetical protein
VVVLCIDGVNSYVHLFPGGTGVYEPHNWLRLVTGTYCGIAMFSLIFPIFNGTVWRQPSAARAVNSLRELAGLCAVAALVILLVLSEQPIFLWSAGLLSTIGVAMMLAMIGTVLFLSLFRRSQCERLARPGDSAAGRADDCLHPDRRLTSCVCADGDVGWHTRRVAQAVRSARHAGVSRFLGSWLAMSGGVRRVHSGELIV